MKKITFFIAFVITSLSASAQTILNPGFETWVPNNETGNTYQMPEHWVTTDILVTYLNELFGNPGYSLNGVSSAAGHTGNDAVQMSVAVSSMGDTVAGGVYYCDSATAMIETLLGGPEALGFPLNTRPANLTGWYKWTNVGNDSAFVIAVMTKWNTTTQSRDTVALGGLDIITSAAPWTAFSVPIIYGIGVNPDTVFIYAGNNSSLPTIGSVFTIDDLAFTGLVPIGINETASTHASVAVMPNPFSEQATLKLDNTQIENGKLEMYDVLGNKVREIQNLSGSSFIISREELPAGIYFYMISEGNALIASGKLSVE